VWKLSYDYPRIFCESSSQFVSQVLTVKPGFHPTQRMQCKALEYCSDAADTGDARKVRNARSWRERRNGQNARIETVSVLALCTLCWMRCVRWKLGFSRSLAAPLRITCPLEWIWMSIECNVSTTGRDFFHRSANMIHCDHSLHVKYCAECWTDIVVQSWKMSAFQSWKFL